MRTATSTPWAAVIGMIFQDDSTAPPSNLIGVALINIVQFPAYPPAARRRGWCARNPRQSSPTLAASTNLLAVLEDHDTVGDPVDLVHTPTAGEVRFDGRPITQFHPLPEVEVARD